MLQRDFGTALVRLTDNGGVLVDRLCHRTVRTVCRDFAQALEVIRQHFVDGFQRRVGSVELFIEEACDDFFDERRRSFCLNDCFRQFAVS